MTKSAKLTQPQVDLLIRMVNEGEDLVRGNGKCWMQDRECHWTGNVHGLTVKALEQGGYIKRDPRKQHHYVITGNGQRALAVYNGAM